MGFPVPGDAIEPSLDLNRHLIANPAATFARQPGLKCEACRGFNGLAISSLTGEWNEYPTIPSTDNDP